MLLYMFDTDIVTTGDGDDDWESSCSFLLDYRLEPHDHLSEVASCSEEGGTSLTSYSMDTQSCSSMSVLDGRPPDSVVNHSRRRNSGLGWGSRGLSPLKSVFSRTK